MSFESELLTTPPRSLFSNSAFAVTLSFLDDATTESIVAHADEQPQIRIFVDGRSGRRGSLFGSALLKLRRRR